MNKKSQSIIYKNIHFYRLLMYASTYGKYFKDYDLLFSLLPQNCASVLELCFGDIYFATLCRKNNISWSGYDISEDFVKFAKRHKFDAIQGNINNVNLKKNYDVIIISRSLYQFKDGLEVFFSKLLKSTKTIIICESIKSLGASKNRLLKSMARYITHSGDSEHNFRYTEFSIIKDMEYISKKFDLFFQKETIKNNNIFLSLTKK